MKRHNVLRYIGLLGHGEGTSRQDLDTARYLVLRRISMRRLVHQQCDISTTRHVIMEDDGRL